MKTGESNTSTMKTPAEIVKKARITYNTGRTKSLEFRQSQLEHLLRMFEENENEILEVLKKDLRKADLEAYFTEVALAKNDLITQIRNLQEWAAPQKAEKGLTYFMDEALVYQDPYGLVLIIGAWNYPIQLTIMPFSAAIAAGNAVILKPSEISSATAEFLARIIPRYLDNECYHVFTGGAPETTELLEERFDYIFFTGSATVARVVYKAASKHLTPVTLELGGKSPVYIDESADMDIAVNRIIWGKCVNAGQTCVAPDYILCTEEVEAQFLARAEAAIKKFFGEDPQQSPDYSRIVSDKHFDRLVKYLRNGALVIGGRNDARDRYIEPSILINVREDEPVMQEEIFGPILPIFRIHDAFDAMYFIAKREKPLALYIFAQDRNVIDKMIEKTSSGGICVNDTLIHVSVPSLPFGGVGQSGMGGYHGKHSFDTFVHKRGALIRSSSKFTEKLQAIRYPPYSRRNFLLFKRILKPPLKTHIFDYLPYALVFVLGILVALLVHCVQW
ncbi:putative aldehyde dehydrogenase [Trypoxylus dichotomus]